jgi:hypothetical protein
MQCVPGFNPVAPASHAGTQAVAGVGFIPLIPLLWLGAGAIGGGLFAKWSAPSIQAQIPPGTTVEQKTFGSEVGEAVGSTTKTLVYMVVIGGLAYWLFVAGGLKRLRR